MASLPALLQTAARSIPAATALQPTRRSAPRKRPAPERERRADRAPRSVDLSRGCRSPESQVPGHRTSSSTATRESAARTAGHASVACVHDPIAFSATGRNTQSVAMASASSRTAASTRCRRHCNSCVSRRRCSDASVGAAQEGAAPGAPIEPTSPHSSASPTHAADIREPHGIHFHINWAGASILTVPKRTVDAMAAKSHQDWSPPRFRRHPTRTPRMTDRRADWLAP